jgi:hypothetical protein
MVQELHKLQQQSSRLYKDLDRDLNRLHIVYLECAIKANVAKYDLMEFKKENSIYL